MFFGKVVRVFRKTSVPCKFEAISKPKPQLKGEPETIRRAEPRIFSGELIQESKPNPATIGSMPTMGTLTGKPDPTIIKARE